MPFYLRIPVCLKFPYKILFPAHPAATEFPCILLSGVSQVRDGAPVFPSGEQGDDVPGQL